MRFLVNAKTVNENEYTTNCALSITSTGHNGRIRAITLDVMKPCGGDKFFGETFDLNTLSTMLTEACINTSKGKSYDSFPNAFFVNAYDSDVVIIMDSRGSNKTILMHIDDFDDLFEYIKLCVDQSGCNLEDLDAANKALEEFCAE